MPSHQGSGGLSNCSSPASTVSTEPCSPSGNGSRSGRQRLRPWLEAQVNSGRHEGLCWLDADKRIFRMTWKHGGRADWSEEDGGIFKAWAVHTGRFREGIDEPDWPTWKTRLRCAINKLKPEYIQELKEQSSSDQEPKPFKVYQFINRQESGSNSPPQSNSQLSTGEKQDDARFPVQNRPSVIQSNNGNIPTFVVSESLDSKPSIDKHEECVASIGSDLQHISLNDLVQTGSMSITNISVDSNISSYTMDTGSLGASSHQQIKLEARDNPTPSHLSEHEMLVTLRFRNEVISQLQITNPHGCRVFYGDMPYQENWEPQVFGSQEADQIPVPYECGQLRSQPQDDYTRKLLAGMELGISIVMDEHNIYMERRCKTRIITVPPNRGAKWTHKVERKEKLKVFDYAKNFLPAFLQYQQGKGPRPSPQVVIAVGQDFNLDEEPYTNLFCSVTVCHAQASYLLSQHTVDTTAPEMSHSDQFDHYMTALTNKKALIPIVSENAMAALPQAYLDDHLDLMQ
ncbi:hypothetical protein ACOMHN_033795 [Nucella lapillus]